MSAVVIIGAGLAGATTAETLRSEGYRGLITIVGEEAHPPYERPGLSKEYLQGRVDAEALQVEPAAWYDEADVDLISGETAVAIDRQNRQVRLRSERVLPYDHLVLATGARPRQLRISGSDSDGVLTLRTLEDSNRLREALAAKQRLAIIGGGWIGLEVAAAARLADCEVSVLERDPFPLGAILGGSVASHFAALHRSHGVDLRTGVTVSAIRSRDGEAVGVETSDGLVPADLVLVGVGAVPNTDLAEDAGLEVDNGVVVDERLRSEDPAILAIGDVANANHTLIGHLRVEHWDNAIRQAKLAAKSILDRPDVYDWQPYFFTDQYDLGMEYVGHATGQDAVTVRGSLSDGSFISFWHRGGVLKAAMNVNIWDVNDQLRALLGTRVSATDLANPEIPLVELARRVA